MIRSLINLTLLAIVWVLLSGAGVVLGEGFAPDWDGTWWQVSLAVVGGLIAGFLALIAPSGVGVRESAIALWLSNLGMDPVIAVAIAVALRIVMTVSELLWAAGGILVVWRRPPTEMIEPGNTG